MRRSPFLSGSHCSPVCLRSSWAPGSSCHSPHPGRVPVPTLLSAAGGPLLVLGWEVRTLLRALLRCVIWWIRVEMPGHRNALFSLRRHQRVFLSGLCQRGHEALWPRARPGLWGAATGAPNMGGPGMLMLTHLQVSALGG